MDKEQIYNKFSNAMYADSRLDSRTSERIVHKLKRILGIVSEEEKILTLFKTQSDRYDKVDSRVLSYSPFRNVNDAIVTAQNLGINVLAVIGVSPGRVEITPDDSTTVFTGTNPNDVARDISEYLYEMVSMREN